MDPKQVSFKEFLTLPAAKQLITFGAIVIVTLFGMWAKSEYDKSSIRDVADKEKKELVEECRRQVAECNAEKFSMAQNFQHDKDEIYKNALQYANSKIEAKEKVIDEALGRAVRVVDRQERTIKNVQIIKATIKKLKNEN